MQKIYTFNQLSAADLIVDAIYQGGKNGNAGDDPISKLAGCGNQGGFRYTGNANSPRLCILYSDLAQPDWPDEMNEELGYFIYYGDNRRPGHELHETKKKGNSILRNIFARLHNGNREQISPLLIFTKAAGGRDVIFRGLAVPGAEGVNQTEDLIAIWKITQGQRFQNYKAIFTILDVDSIRRNWIKDIQSGLSRSKNAPDTWIDWVENGVYKPLKAARTVNYRTKIEQLPKSPLEIEIVDTIVKFFKNHPLGEYAFEKCAAEIARLMDRNIIDYTLTRPWRDGGRDALGSYSIGLSENSIKVEFALEAKCHQREVGSGVRETSRLISRLRHRQFGIFVTTSYVDTQAYKEIIEDQHPVVILTGSDMAKILIKSGYTSIDTVNNWLQANFQ